MKNFAALRFVFLLFIMTTLKVSFAASFDCSKASTAVEGSICANAALSDLDSQLGAAYKKARLLSLDPAALQKEQLSWIKKRNTCGANVNCLTQSYTLRISELGGDTAGKARPSAQQSTQSTSVNALAYVMNKKWSLGNLSCSLNGGAYQVYTRNAPLGYVFYAGGKPNISNNPQEFQFFEKNNNEFTHIGKIGANDFVRRQLRIANVLTAEIRTDVKLVSPNKIEYRKTIRQINFDAMLNGKVLYDTKNETGFGNLCP
jgi:uncharacterized protein